MELAHTVLPPFRPATDQDVPDGDVVIATWWETAEWVRDLSPQKGAKVYFIQHHEVFEHLPQQRCRATYTFPMHKIVIARWLRDLMYSEYGDAHVDLVPNSVDQSQFFSPPRGRQPVPTVGLLYSSIRFKGLEVALSAIQRARRSIPELRVVSFGAEQPTPELPLPQGAEFTLLPHQDELRSLYGRCDAWVAASHTEGFNLPVMEAMACRTPAASTRTGWPEQAIVSGENGVLVDVGDAQGLANALGWLVTQPDDRWRKLSQRAYETATAYTWQDSAKLFEAALTHARERAAMGEIAGGASMPRAVQSSSRG
jgi:glycosyltransferase involved in cell wall biosynthesis